jgi:broad specificity phosphatase PhoE
MQGWGNAELTETGVQNALALGQRLKEVSIDVIYSSMSKRATHTAELITASREVPIIQDDLLREMSFGDWEGKFRDEIEKEYSAEFTAFWETPHLY